jgi:hypothetical protein
MSSQLPLLPSIDHLRHQARNLFELCRSGDSSAIEQLCDVFPDFRALSVIEIAASVRLHNAQDVVARYYGFHKWPHLNESVDMARRAASTLSAAMDDPKMEDFDYRVGIARSKGLPEIIDVAPFGKT